MRVHYIIFLLAAVIVFTFVVAVLQMGYHRPPEFPIRLHMPSRLASASVVTGKNFLTKKPFIRNSSLDSVTGIVIGELDSAPGLEIGIAAARGALIVDKDGRKLSKVVFTPALRHVDIVDVESDGICEYVGMDDSRDSISLFNHIGKTRWTYKNSDAIDDMVAGDLDGDGLPEFAVGFNGGGGIHLLQTDGKVASKETDDGNVWHVEITDTNGDGRQEILHSNVTFQLLVRNGRGRIISDRPTEPSLVDFSLTYWPTKSNKEYIITSDPDEITFIGSPVMERDSIWILNFDGETIKRLDAPLSSFGGSAAGLPVRLQDGRKDYFAVLVNLKHWDRAVLYVYDSNSKLVYQEIMPEACAAIASINAGKSREALLIGGKGVVWRYEANLKK